MEALGIDLKWFLFQLGNFIVLFVGLTYILHKPLLKFLEDRRAEIAQGLENAEQIKHELTATQDKQEEILAVARKESSALLAETKQKAKELEEQLTASAEEKVKALEEKARQEISAERETLRKELKAEVATLVVQATEKVLGEDVSTEKKKELTKKVNGLTS